MRQRVEVLVIAGKKEIFFSVQRGGATHVEGSLSSLPGSQTCCAGRAKVPKKATNLALVV